MIKELSYSLAVSAFVFLVGFSLWATIVMPVSKRLLAVQVEISNVEKENSSLRQRLASGTASQPTKASGNIFMTIEEGSDPSLDLQSIVSSTSNDLNLDALLLGPYDTEDLVGGVKVTIEYETEGRYPDVLNFLNKLENIQPPIAISAFQIRPIQNYEENSDEVYVYARALIWAVYQE